MTIGVLQTGHHGRLRVSGDELRIRHLGLKRQISAAELRVAARVRLEQVLVDPADDLEQRRRRRDRRRGPGNSGRHSWLESRSSEVVGIERERAALRHHIAEAIGQHLHVRSAGRVWPLVQDGEHERWIRGSMKPTGPNRDAGVQAVEVVIARVAVSASTT